MKKLSGRIGFGVEAPNVTGLMTVGEWAKIPQSRYRDYPVEWNKDIPFGDVTGEVAYTLVCIPEVLDVLRLVGPGFTVAGLISDPFSIPYGRYSIYRERRTTRSLNAVATDLIDAAQMMGLPLYDRVFECSESGGKWSMATLGSWVLPVSVGGLVFHVDRDVYQVLRTVMFILKRAVAGKRFILDENSIWWTERQSKLFAQFDLTEVSKHSIRSLKTGDWGDVNRYWFISEFLWENAAFVTPPCEPFEVFGCQEPKCLGEDKSGGIILGCWARDQLNLAKRDEFHHPYVVVRSQLILPKSDSMLCLPLIPKMCDRIHSYVPDEIGQFAEVTFVDTNFKGRVVNLYYDEDGQYVNAVIQVRLA
jgi:hypothetical protein